MKTGSIKWMIRSAFIKSVAMTVVLRREHRTENQESWILDLLLSQVKMASHLVILGLSFLSSKMNGLAHQCHSFQGLINIVKSFWRSSVVTVGHCFSKCGSFTRNSRNLLKTQIHRAYPRSPASEPQPQQSVFTRFRVILM